jgi:hypothetical protein
MQNASRRDALRDRAAFDFSCRKDQLTLTVLDENALGGELAIGVEGCNQRATYVTPPGGGTWVLNTPTGKAVSAVSPAPETKENP